MCDKKLHVVAAQFVLFKSLRLSDFKCPRTLIKKRKLTTSEQSFSQKRLPQSFSVVNFVKFYHLQNSYYNFLVQENYMAFQRVL